ncbi:MAG: exodeoxyribonuclease VII small subunit [Clostridia bacterium]|nr:exodeoxyribonuclease VII small subunit [Clostridia bacterium]
MTAKKKEPGFEERLAQVETLIGELEEGNLPLAEALNRYEAGIKALDAIEKELGEATQRLTILRAQADGTEAEEPLEAGL